MTLNAVSSWPWRFESTRVERTNRHGHRPVRARPLAEVSADSSASRAGPAGASDVGEGRGLTAATERSQVPGRRLGG